MKKIIIYSSKTGNTKKVAEACHKRAGKDWILKNTEDEFDIKDYSEIVLGFWVDKGSADERALNLIKKIEGKKVSLFGTLGAYPDSDHAKESMERVKTMVEENNNEVRGTFMCQGAIDPKLIEWMNSLPSEHPHYPNKERKKRWAEAEKHPNQKDFDNAGDWFEKTLVRGE